MAQDDVAELNGCLCDPAPARLNRQREYLESARKPQLDHLARQLLADVHDQGPGSLGSGTYVEAEPLRVRHIEHESVLRPERPCLRTAKQRPHPAGLPVDNLRPPYPYGRL